MSTMRGPGLGGAMRAERTPHGRNARAGQADLPKRKPDLKKLWPQIKALVETNRLSTVRYRGGLDSYLQVLDAERNLFQGELVLAQLRREELLGIVQLYRALGGGWQ